MPCGQPFPHGQNMLRLLICTGGFMWFWRTLTTSLLIAIVVPAVFAVFWFFKVRGEKKMPSEDRIRTRPPKAVSGFFLGFALLVLFGGIAGIIYCCIADSENTTVQAVIVLSVCIALFSALGFFGYAYIRFNYVIADADGIHVYRLFRKKRFYRYEDIGCFYNSTGSGMMGGLKGYDKSNRKIFAVEAVHIGVSAVVQKLREHGVTERMNDMFHR